MNKGLNKIFIAGYGGSGSSAVFDLLKEVQGITAIDAELRFISDPDGILSLFRASNEDWSPYNYDLAIKRYIKLINYLSSKYSKKYCGLNLSAFFNEKLKNYSFEYLNRLSSLQFKGIWYGICSTRIRLLHKLYFKYKLPANLFFDDIYLKSERDFIEETNNYFDRLLNEASGNQDDIGYFLIDEPYISLYLEEATMVFENSKYIVVERDPRDIYVNAKKAGFTFIPSKPEAFITWYNNLITCKSFNYQDGDRIIKLKFEELILDYKNVKKQILDFLEIDEALHIKPYQYLDPSVSSGNIGLWKSYDHPNEIDFIQNNVANTDTLFKA